MNDSVNHPKHYTTNPSGVECITVVEHMSFNVGNAIKYLWRTDLKGDALEDLKKARWYVDREIARRTRVELSNDIPAQSELPEPRIVPAQSEPPAWDLVLPRGDLIRYPNKSSAARALQRFKETGSVNMNFDWNRETRDETRLPLPPGIGKRLVQP